MPCYETKTVPTYNDQVHDHEVVSNLAVLFHFVLLFYFTAPFKQFQREAKRATCQKIT